MTAIQEIKAFQTAIRANVAEAVKNGVPLQNVILELSQQEFKIQMIALQLNAQKEARELATQIVPANGHLALPDFKAGRG